MAAIVAAFEKIAKCGGSKKMPTFKKQPTLKILFDSRKPAISMPRFRQMCMRGKNIVLNRSLIRKFGAKIFG